MSKNKPKGNMGKEVIRVKAANEIIRKEKKQES